MGRRLIALLPVGLPIAFCLWTGLRGLDFGHHWDEGIHIRAVARSIEAGTLLPGNYLYGSVPYSVAMATALPDAIAIAARSDRRVSLTSFLASPELEQRLVDRILQPRFKLRLRAVFLCLSASALLWVYLLALWLGRGTWEALLAASLLALSWEVAYHARWIAPDGLMMALATLTLAFCVRSAVPGPRRRTWLALGAASAGVACGTKYTAGLLVVPLLVAVARGRSPSSAARAPLWTAIGVLTVFASAFVLSTPGAIFDSETFFAALRHQLRVYGSGHLGYSVSPGWQHLARSSEYLARVMLSPHPWIALALALAAVFGIAQTLRHSRGEALLLLSFPALYLGFMSSQRVMIARNLLVLAPFLALFAARGLWAWSGLLPDRIPRRAVHVAIALLLVPNAVWLVGAAESIRYREEPARFVAEMIRYLESRPDEAFFVSPRVERHIRESTLANASRSDPDAAAWAVLYASEGMDAREWPVLGLGMTKTWFGPRDVNFDYYPTWRGADRILVMPMAAARAAGVRILQDGSD